MNKRKIVKPTIVLMTLIILGLLIIVISLNIQFSYRQRIIDEACRSILFNVHFSYDYDSMDEAEIREIQAVEINSLRNAQLLIYQTSWTDKDKINSMVVSLTSYYNNIYLEGKKIEELKASKINEQYMRVLINIDNEYCEPAIDSILEFLDNEN